MVDLKRGCHRQLDGDHLGERLNPRQFFYARSNGMQTDDPRQMHTAPGHRLIHLAEEETRWHSTPDIAVGRSMTAMSAPQPGRSSRPSASAMRIWAGLSWASPIPGPGRCPATTTS